MIQIRMTLRPSYLLGGLRVPDIADSVIQRRLRLRANYTRSISPGLVVTVLLHRVGGH
jgi:hypothetical protein